MPQYKPSRAGLTRGFEKTFIASIPPLDMENALIVGVSGHDGTLLAHHRLELERQPLIFVPISLSQSTLMPIRIGILPCQHIS
jgi:hypothetical protein